MLRANRARPLALAIAVAVWASACDPGAGGSTDGMATCAAPLDETCAPLYAPTFEAIYTRRLGASCAAGGEACHGSGAQGGLDLSTRARAFAGLVGEGRAAPGDPDCGELVARLLSTDRATQMPPGLPLAPAELCAVRLWLARGALEYEP